MPAPVELHRDEFVNSFWDYRAGEHVAIIAPTGAGKSYLAWQLLGRTMEDHPSLQTTVFMPKPWDSTTSRNATRLNMKIIDSWPYKKRFWEDRPNGLVLWPKHNQTVDARERHRLVGTELQKGLNDQYWAGNSISFIDDAHSAATFFDINPLIEETLTNGRAGGAGMWLATQRASGTRLGGISTYAYSSPSKMFFSRDNDENNLDRMAEIGSGTDPKQMKEWVRNLRTFRINDNPVGEFLYMDRSGPYFARVLPW